MDKQQQKQHLIDMMQDDEKLGLYEEKSEKEEVKKEIIMERKFTIEGKEYIKKDCTCGATTYEGCSECLVEPSNTHTLGEVVATDYDGKDVHIGDKVKGEGFISFQDGFRIDLSPIVTVRKSNDEIYFGGLSKKSFGRFWLIESNNEKRKLEYRRNRQ